MKRLADRHAVVTGAGRGIGRAIAIELAAQGALVTAVARSRDQLDDLAAGIRAAGGRVVVAPADVGTPAGVDSIPSGAEGWPPVGVLVNAAGTFGPLQLVAEHQSGPERDVAYVGCAYMERLRDRWVRGGGGSRTTLPPGLALVVYQGPGAWPAPRRLGELIALPAGPLGEFLEPFQTEQRLCLIELGLLDYARLRAFEAPAAGVLALMLLKAAPSKDLGPAWQAAGELVLIA